MSFEDVLSQSLEVLFVASGVLLTLAAIRKDAGGREEHIPPSAHAGELAGMFLAALCAAVGPNILVVGLTPGLPEMPALSRYALLPSVLILMFLLWQSRCRGWARLSNRILVGIWAGAVATGTLDVVRLGGFHLGLMPGNMPRMFGVLILDRMAEGPTPFSDLIGYLYHYWVGACFGLTLTLLCGKVRWWAGLVWGLLIELGMMVTPPMVVAMDTGYFGLKHGPGLLLVSLTAHVVYGIMLGVLAEKYTLHRGSLISMMRGRIGC